MILEVDETIGTLVTDYDVMKYFPLSLYRQILYRMEREFGVENNTTYWVTDDVEYRGKEITIKRKVIERW